MDREGGGGGGGKELVLEMTDVLCRIAIFCNQYFLGFFVLKKDEMYIGNENFNPG